MKTLVSLISFLAILLVALPGPLYKFGILELGTAFAALRFGVYAGIAALVLILIQIIFMRKNISWAGVAVCAVLALVAVGLPMSMMSKAKSVPPIHDISTDLTNPPKFVAIVALRADAPNPVEYAGEETAKQQREAYPELTTQKYSQSTDQLFDATESAVNSLGWELVNADKSLGIIEATETTAWFGFKDDVVVRIRTTGEESFLDVRSKSRVGKSDLGKNAERIHTLIDAINSQL
ncbi:DUF1499 domain-containing protein [Paraglaciecola chathamensis]|jgi:uncharacterized protein (DUF1499 family)|uniref:DUF1499 domain-containing protein n=3 Tax=Paraglaciecola chathamensis TaxID=368405 RepID=A0A8H9ICJ8_9ALTE|nr:MULTISPECIES: DUF1499 domain-containing protein [Paraglaciecola]MDO6560647.1 DUF1499 domain-containing protein [Paraglaciecola chathamensis]MDO6841867.1 DUF1499 domain-containing protein [Paraglaciecola chathamensis]GAC06388.1 hypothetical protein GAGA_3555 [Paraglaciecola agarilytica NO2]GAC08241.1 hypothetical protein GCHA_0276 [Paraglaciecola chathamensis S18K6]GGZ75733.1 hypothetical protein GCM10011274_37570 [Paraglaciecola oceanifecundans]